MDYEIIKQQGKIALIKSGKLYYIVRIDQVGQVFCRVPHPAVAGKSKIGRMDKYGLDDVAFGLPEYTAFELFDRITAIYTKALR